MNWRALGSVTIALGACTALAGAALVALAVVASPALLWDPARLMGESVLGVRVARACVYVLRGVVGIAAGLVLRHERFAWPASASGRALCLVLGVHFAVGLTWADVTAMRCIGQMRAQWGASAEDKRSDWMEYQGFDSQDVLRARAQIAPNDGVLVVATDRPNSRFLVHLMQYHLQPGQVYERPRDWKPGEWDSAWMRKRNVRWVLYVKDSYAELQPARP